MESFKIETLDLEIPFQYINLIRYGFKIFKNPFKILVIWTLKKIFIFYLKVQKCSVLTTQKNIIEIFELDNSIHLLDAEGGIYKLNVENEVSLVELISLDCKPLAITSVKDGFSILKHEKENLFLEIYEKSLVSINYQLFASIQIPGICPQFNSLNKGFHLLSGQEQEFNRFLKEILIVGEVDHTQIIFIALQSGQCYYISFNFNNKFMDKIHFLPHLNQPICNLFLQPDNIKKYNNIIIAYKTGLLMKIAAKSKNLYETITIMPSEIFQVCSIDQIILASDSVNIWEHTLGDELISNKLDLKGVDFICSLPEESIAYILTEMGIIYQLIRKSDKPIEESQKQIENIKQYFEVVEPQNNYFRNLTQLICKNKKIIEALNIATSYHLKKMNITTKFKIFSINNYFLKILKKENVQTINQLFSEKDMLLKDIYLMEIFLENSSDYIFDKDVWSLFISIQSDGKEITNVTSRIKSHFIPSNPLHLLLYVHLKELHFPIVVKINFVSELYSLTNELGSPWIYVLLSETELDASYFLFSLKTIQYMDERATTNEELPLFQQCIYTFKIPSDFEINKFLKSIQSNTDSPVEMSEKHFSDKWNILISNVLVKLSMDPEKEFLKISSNNISMVRFVKSIIIKIIKEQSEIYNNYDFHFIKEKAAEFLEKVDSPMEIKPLHDFYKILRSEFLMHIPF